MNQEPVAAEVLAGLARTPKQISPKFFYDETGSELFDEITRLNEYYLPRVERQIYAEHYEAICEHIGAGRTFIEPGAGSCAKVRWLLPKLAPAAYVPMDISAEHLQASAAQLSADVADLNVVPHVCDHTQGLDTDSIALPESDQGPVFFYPGSSVGNFEPADAISFLTQMRSCMSATGESGGGLLIGVDTKKDTAVLDAAYNDDRGVTARFNLNVLPHLNRLVGADLDPQKFEHLAFYNADAGRIEMHLRCLEDCAADVAGEQVSFAAGEQVNTEYSYKYRPDEFVELAAEAAAEVADAGGNAVDAAIAACAVQCVVEPMSTGIGGDCFVLLQKAGQGPVIGLNGSGHAPEKLTADHLLDQGQNAIGLTSPHAITVPGAIDAWCKISADHGRLGMDRVLKPAIDYAENGFAITPRVAVDWSRNVDKLAADANSARQYLRDGKSPAAGQVWRSPELANTLKAVAARGRDGFYSGAVAEDMVTYLNSVGALHTMDDFAAQSADYVDPISSDYAGRQVLEIPPNGQGITALMMLNILKRFDLTKFGPVSAERLHLEAEATRLAFAQRDAAVADPRFADVPVDHLLSDKLADEMAGKINMDRAMPDDLAATGPISCWGTHT